MGANHIAIIDVDVIELLSAAELLHDALDYAAFAGDFMHYGDAGDFGEGLSE